MLSDHKAAVAGACDMWAFGLLLLELMREATGGSSVTFRKFRALTRSKSSQRWW